MSTLNLLPHNQRPYNDILKYYNRNLHSILYVAGTGTGKTYIAKALLNTLWNDCHVMYVVPTNAIKDYLLTVLGDIKNIDMYTYESFTITDRVEYMHSNYDVAIFDEAHHLGSSIEGSAAVQFMSIFKGVCFGMTATPDREDGVIIEDFFDKVIYGLDNYNAIQRGLMPPFEYYICNTQDAQEICKTYKLTVDLPNSKELLLPIINTHSMNRILAFYRSVSEMKDGAKELANLFPHYTIKTLSHLTEDIPKTISILKEDHVILCSCDLLLEGLHVPEVDAILLFRNVQRTRVLQQILGRISNIGRTESPVVIDFSSTASKLYIKIMSEDYKSSTRHSGALRTRRELKPMLKIPAVRVETFDLMSMLAAIQGGPVCVLGREFSSLKAACRYYEVKMANLLSVVPSVNSLDDAFRRFVVDSYYVDNKFYKGLHEVCKAYHIPAKVITEVAKELQLPVSLVIDDLGEFPIVVNSITYNNPMDIAKSKGSRIIDIIRDRYKFLSYFNVILQGPSSNSFIVFGRSYESIQQFCKPLKINIGDITDLSKTLNLPLDKAAEVYCRTNKVVVMDKVYNARNTMATKLNINVLMNKYYQESLSLDYLVQMCLDPDGVSRTTVYYESQLFLDLKGVCYEYDISVLDVLSTYHNTGCSLVEAIDAVRGGSIETGWVYNGTHYRNLATCLKELGINYNSFNRYVLNNNVTLRGAIKHFKNI